MSDITQNQKSMKKFYDDISEKYDLIFSLSPLHKTFFAEEIKGKKVLDQKLVREKTFILKIDGNISTEEKKKLELQDPTILCEKDCIFFKNEKNIVDIQRILLQEGHYIVGMSIQNNNLKKLFLAEETI